MAAVSGVGSSRKPVVSPKAASTPVPKVEPRKDASSSPVPKIGLEQFKGEIEKRAAEVYNARVATHRTGDALSDWLTAESEIKRKNNIS
jgi:hypothetical protein